MNARKCIVCVFPDGLYSSYFVEFATQYASWLFRMFPLYFEQKMKTFITNSTDKIPTIFGWPKAIWGINNAKCTQITIKPLIPMEYKNPTRFIFDQSTDAVVIATFCWNSFSFLNRSIKCHVFHSVLFCWNLMMRYPKHLNTYFTCFS